MKASETSLLEQVTALGSGPLGQGHRQGRQGEHQVLAEAAIAPGKLDPEVAAAIRWGIWSGFLACWINVLLAGNKQKRWQLHR